MQKNCGQLAGLKSFYKNVNMSALLLLFDASTYSLSWLRFLSTDRKLYYILYREYNRR